MVRAIKPAAEERPGAARPATMMPRMSSFRPNFLSGCISPLMTGKTVPSGKSHTDVLAFTAGPPRAAHPPARNGMRLNRFISASASASIMSTMVS